MSSKDWQVGPVLKDKPGSQGTLFRGGTKYFSDARYPRGYTPGRLHEVANAVQQPYAKQGAKSNEYRDHPYKTRNQETGDWEVVGRANNEPKRRLVDNVARSTVPIEHLQPKAPARNLSFWVHESFDKQHAADNTAGTYQGDPPGHMGSRNDIHIATNAVSGTTPIHEIGHHVSNLMNTDHTAYGKGSARPVHVRGQEEGFADAYSFEHFRDRRGKRLESLRTYQPNPSTHQGRQDEFHQGYESTRGDIPKPVPSWQVGMHKSVTESPTWKAGQQGQPGLFQMSMEGPPGPNEKWTWAKGSWQDD